MVFDRIALTLHVWPERQLVQLSPEISKSPISAVTKKGVLCRLIWLKTVRKVGQKAELKTLAVFILRTKYVAF